MKVRDQLNDIEQQLQYRGLVVPERRIMLSWMSNELNELTGRYEFDWTATRLDPAISTQDGKRNYPLPAGFPENFMRGANTERGDEFCCFIDDGDTEAPLHWESPAVFFSRSLRDATDSKPATYTILSLPDGRRELWLDPPPDDVYEVDGVYQRTDWTLDELDNLPPLPGNSAILKYGVLRRCDPNYQQQYDEALASLALRAAQARPSRIVANLSDTSADTYSLMGN